MAALAKEEAHGFAGLCAQCHAHANLSGALGDDGLHHRVDADGGENKCDGRECAEEPGLEFGVARGLFREAGQGVEIVDGLLGVDALDDSANGGSQGLGSGFRAHRK